MKRLKDLKNLLQNLTFGNLKKSQAIEKRQPNVVITKSFSKDEDLFLFI